MHLMDMTLEPLIQYISCYQFTLFAWELQQDISYQKNDLNFIIIDYCYYCFFWNVAKTFMLVIIIIIYTIINQMLCKCLTNINYNLRIINNHCFKENNKYQIKYIQVNISQCLSFFAANYSFQDYERFSWRKRERERDKERDREREIDRESYI